MFLFAEDSFGLDVSVSCEHQRSSSVLDGDLFHEARVFDGVALLLGSTVAVCVSVVPLGAHSVPEKRDELPSPYSFRAVFSILLLVVWKANEQVKNLRQSPQNFVEITRPSAKVRLLHSLLSVDTGP